MPPLRDLTGQEFGHLLVLKRVFDYPKRGTFWLCQCSCGNQKVIGAVCLVTDHTKSCGCQRYKHSHGLSQTREYKSWEGMMARCYNTNHMAFANYGGRNIVVCQNWHDVVVFVNDMSHRPKGYTLERINNDLPYSCGYCDECSANNWPANCKWATPEEQAANRRNTKRYTYQGKTLTTTEWEKETGIPRRNIQQRIRNGWSVAKALTTPIETKYHPNR